MTGPIYAVITADIVGSTEYYRANGEPLRPILLDVLGKINERNRTALAVPFSITLGDEFQGLVSEPAKCPRIVYDLRLLLSPLKCRVGVGLGTIVSDITESTSQMEGLAFSMSREALEAAEKAKSALTVYRGDEPTLESAANALSLLIDVVQSRWSAKQWEAVRLYSELGELTKVGQALGVSWQAIDARLRQTNWKDVLTATQSLADLLSKMAG